MSYNCENCGSVLYRYARVCPHCRLSPASLGRDIIAEDREKREARAVGRAEDRGGGFPWISAFLVLAAIGAVVAFVKWVGLMIGLRFGNDFMPIMAVVFITWLGFGVFVIFVANDKGWGAGKTYGPLGSFFVALALVLFLPHSIGLGELPPDVAAEFTDETTPTSSEATVQHEEAAYVTAAEADPSEYQQYLATEMEKEMARTEQLKAQNEALDAARVAANSQQPYELIRTESISALSDADDLQRTSYRCEDGSAWFITAINPGTGTATFIPHRGEHPMPGEMGYASNLEARARVCPLQG